MSATVRLNSQKDKEGREQEPIRQWCRLAACCSQRASIFIHPSDAISLPTLVEAMLQPEAHYHELTHLPSVATTAVLPFAALPQPGDPESTTPKADAAALAASPFACDPDDMVANSIALKPGGKHIKVRINNAVSLAQFCGQCSMVPAMYTSIELSILQATLGSIYSKLWQGYFAFRMHAWCQC